MPPIQPASDQTGRDAHLRTNILVAVLAFAGITDALTQALVYPIVPHLPRYLNASASDTAWTVTVILLCGAVATPVMGRLGDMYGKRRMLLFNVGLLVAGSVICALSDSLAPMIVGRALQGLANGIIPLGVSILRDEVPVARLPMATAVMLGSLGVGTAIGLPASAFIADNVDWHLLFWAGAALAAVAAVLVVMYVPESKVRTGGRVDVTGALGMTAGLVCPLLAIFKGAEDSRSGPFADHEAPHGPLRKAFCRSEDLIALYHQQTKNLLGAPPMWLSAPAWRPEILGTPASRP